MATASKVERVTSITLELTEDEATYLSWLTGYKVVGQGKWRHLGIPERR